MEKRQRFTAEFKLQTLQRVQRMFGLASDKSTVCIFRFVGDLFELRQRAFSHQRTGC